jgi:hypothetical protein
MIYRGQDCTESRAFDDATGTGTEWRFPANSATGLPWPVGEQWCSRQYTTRVVTQAEQDATALSEVRSEDSAVAGLHLATPDIERHEPRPAEECRQLVAGAGEATHLLRTVVAGVRVKIPVIPDDEGEV